MTLRILAFVPIFAAASAAVARVEPVPPVEIAATVNGETIKVAELDAVLEVDLPRATLTAGQRKQLRAALLEDLIDEKLLRQFLAKNAAKVEPAEIEAQMAALKAQLLKENRALADFLKQTGQTEHQLRDDWTAQIQLTNYVKQLATDDKLKAYHAANRDHFDKVEVRVSHIIVRVGKSAPPVERATAKEKLQAIRADLAAGKTTFPAAAKRYSQCPTALKNGDLGFIRRRGLSEDEPLAKAAFALAVNGLSEVVESERGLHLLMVTERKAGTPSSIEKCTVEVLETFTEDTRVELVKQLRKEAKITVSLP